MTMTTVNPTTGETLRTYEPMEPAAVDEAITFNQFDQDTISLGARYDFAKNAALKMQVDWAHSRDNPSMFWVEPDPDWDGRATLFSVTLDFVF